MHKCAMTKKFFLWMMVLLQIFFICCFWLLQMASSSINVHNNNSNNNGQIDESDSFSQKMLTNNNLWQQRTTTISTTNYFNQRVNFITKNAQKPKTTKYITKKQKFHNNNSNDNDDDDVGVKNSLINVNNFLKDFFLKKQQPNRLNINESAFETATTTELELKNLWCYREGTLNETQNSVHDDTVAWNWQEKLPQCECQTGWHGRDCGQPEIIWRALMTTATSKRPFKLLQPTLNGTVQRLFYFIEGNFFNLDFLELQIQMLAGIVDYFIIFHRNDKKVTNNEFKLLQRTLREIFSKRNNYFIYSCSQYYENEATTITTTTATSDNTNNCTIANAYEQFKRKTTAKPQPTDLLLYTDEHVLLQANTLKFLKYYTMDVYLIRLRLKYNVYGFYWQHPTQTHLDGLISSFKHLEDIEMGGGNLKQLLHAATSINGAVGGFIVGDLNHFAGWYCLYCLQPDEIIMELLANVVGERPHKNEVQFPKMPRNRQIDTLYLQKLIAQGIYIDGETQLERMRRYTDKYFAPNYAETYNWKFNHLLVNLYESLDDDIEVDDGIY